MCASCITRKVSLAIRRNASALNAGSTLVTAVRSSPGTRLLAALVELAVEVGEHLVVERVQLLLGGFTLGQAAADPGDVQESVADGLREGDDRWQRVGH